MKCISSFTEALCAKAKWILLRLTLLKHIRSDTS